jgi:Sec-independent protein translocase protein TatA
MNVRELNEANFADTAEQTLRDIGSMAKNAFGKFKDAHEKASSEVKRDIEKQAKRDKRDAAKSKEKKKQQKSAAANSIAGHDEAFGTIAKIVVQRTPSADDLDEFNDLGAEQFQNLLSAVPRLQTQLVTFRKEFLKQLGEAPFVDEIDRHEIPSKLSDQNPRALETADELLMKNKFKEQEAWLQVLTTQSFHGIKQIVNLVGRIREHNQAKNLADISVTTNKKHNLEVYAMGRFWYSQHGMLITGGSSHRLLTEEQRLRMKDPVRRCFRPF